ncbi:MULTISPECIES: glycosyltransferase family 2 protein [unclassified Aureispira]|uniref:glycosyltransferase family 2 protein n=1 Tax=unclassified Aureispira TaxID=2649989 RepID=UPI000AD176B1|nr:MULTISPECIES: glycosyltransferase family 2 protein [unclassified Aureispira]WMX12149.1 glycosyltransferase family 2 protein [Aureispira sp. CCB-E]
MNKYTLENKDNLNIAVLIPCLNEEKTIGNVIEQFQKELPAATVYVYDNNSSDKTSEVAMRFNAIVRKEYNKGKGNVVVRMFGEIEADIYILIDGDDTYPIDKVNLMIDELLVYNVDMVVGDRLSNQSYQKENKRKFHVFGNYLIKKLINVFFNTDLKDILSGYRIFSYSFVKNYSSLAQGFELETDLSIFALHYGVGIREVPIDYRDRPEDSHSKLNTFQDGIKIIMTFFNLYRFYKPLSFFSILALILSLIGVGIGMFPIYEYIKFSYVYKVPTAILALGLIIIALLLLCCGLILDSIVRIEKKNTMLKIRQKNEGISTKSSR